MHNSPPSVTPVSFDPCGVEGTEAGCATCPMAAECLPAPLFESLDEFFRDPSEPQDIMADLLESFS